MNGPTDEQLNDALAWIFRDLGGIPQQPHRPVKVRMAGGYLDEKRVEVAQFRTEMKYVYEEDHAMLEGVKVRKCDAYWPSFFAPLTYVYVGTFRR